MRAFTPRVVAGLETRIREISRALLDPFIPRGEMDLATDYAVPLPMMVIAEMLGLAPMSLSVTAFNSVWGPRSPGWKRVWRYRTSFSG